MDPWYKVVTLRKEVREGRSFNPDEFAIALEQVVSNTAPVDYCNPEQFFSRNCFTRVLVDHTSIVLRRLSGKTDNTAPVFTLMTQFGGGKTHTLTVLYHLANSGEKASSFSGVPDLLKQAGLSSVPKARVAVFVGNAWDPHEGRETPWIDIARQLAGDKGVELLGKDAKSTPPGTEALFNVFQAADAPVLLLFDEVLNFLNRHRPMADQFHSFIQNLTVAMTGTKRGVAIISLPRSEVEMSEWDLKWQEKINKVVRRVAKDLIVNDDSEIGSVIRRRLFDNIGNERAIRSVCKTYADWCFEHRAELPSEWTSVDTATTEAKAREFLKARFEACYPFHPATLSVFQRKWQSLQQYQQTRGTLAMLAQWLSLASQESFRKARTEPFITLGSAPLYDSNFRSVILGQLGEPRLAVAIETDIAGEQSHARVLDKDTKGLLRDIHRRVGATILFESSGGQVDKVAHLPELRFALSEPQVDTTSVDNAAIALEEKSYYIRKLGTDGYKIGYKPTIKKVVNDRRASLDEESEIKPAIHAFIKGEFQRGASIPVVLFPSDSSEIDDTPKLKLVVVDPETEWESKGSLRNQIIEWTRHHGKSPRLYPAALIWCIKKPGRELREKAELLLAWKRVENEVREGALQGDFDRSDIAEIKSKITLASDAMKDEVWSNYRFVVVTDSKEASGLSEIDLGAGHSSSGETLCGRIIASLKAKPLLNESVGAGYIERNWPPAFKDMGAWPLSSIRQSFLNGSLTRLIDPDAILRKKIVEFVSNGDFGLASGQNQDGTYGRLWFNELISLEEVVFESDVFLIAKEKATALKTGSGPVPAGTPVDDPTPKPESPDDTVKDTPVTSETKRVRITGNLTPEVWNRFGQKIIPKLRSGTNLEIGVDFTAELNSEYSNHTIAELKQLIDELGLSGKIRIE